MTNTQKRLAQIETHIDELLDILPGAQTGEQRNMIAKLVNSLLNEKAELKSGTHWLSDLRITTQTAFNAVRRSLGGKVMRS